MEREKTDCLHISLTTPLFLCWHLDNLLLIPLKFQIFFFLQEYHSQDPSEIGQSGCAIDARPQGTHDAPLSDYHNKRHTTRVPDPFSFRSVVYEFMMRAMFFGSLKMKRKKTKSRKNIDILCLLPLCKLFRMNVRRVLLGFNIFSDPRRNLQLTKLNPEYSCLECGPVGAAAAIWHRRRR